MLSVEMFTLPETNGSPLKIDENGSSQSQMSSPNHQFSGAIR